MNERAFAKRLEPEIPGWQAKGWGNADGGTAMLAVLFDGNERFRETLF